METGFFKWIWRFNALLIFAGALLLVCILLWETTRQLRRQVFPTPTTSTLTIPTEESNAEDVAKQILKFGSPSNHNASDLYALPLYAEQQNNNLGYSKGSSNSLLNYLIIDTGRQSNRWLFPNTERLILDTRQVVYSSEGSSTSLGHVLAVIETDTNGDGRLSRQDSQAIYLTDPTWVKPVKLRDGVTSIIAIKAVSTADFDFIFSTSKGNEAVRYNASTAKVVAQQNFTARD